MVVISMHVEGVRCNEYRPKCVCVCSKKCVHHPEINIFTMTVRYARRCQSMEEHNQYYGVTQAIIIPIMTAMYIYMPKYKGTQVLLWCNTGHHYTHSNDFAMCTYMPKYGGT